jgi:hypothetical protein
MSLQFDFDGGADRSALRFDGFGCRALGCLFSLLGMFFCVPFQPAIYEYAFL